MTAGSALATETSHGAFACGLAFPDGTWHLSAACKRPRTVLRRPAQQLVSPLLCSRGCVCAPAVLSSNTGDLLWIQDTGLWSLLIPLPWLWRQPGVCWHTPGHQRSTIHRCVCSILSCRCVSTHVQTCNAHQPSPPHKARVCSIVCSQRHVPPDAKATAFYLTSLHPALAPLPRCAVRVFIQTLPPPYHHSPLRYQHLRPVCEVPWPGLRTRGQPRGHQLAVWLHL